MAAKPTPRGDELTSIPGTTATASRAVARPSARTSSRRRARRLSPPNPVSPEQLETLSTVLDLVRTGNASTRAAVARQSGLGRTVVAQRLTQLSERGLVERGDMGPSTGGRAPRELHFRRRAGVVLAAELGATGLTVGLTDLRGEVLVDEDHRADIAEGPEPILALVEDAFDRLLEHPEAAGATVWGVGMGLPGPVEFASGSPSAPPIMPGWDGYPVRNRLAERYGVPVWVDNEVNTMALGEFRVGVAQGEQDFFYVKIGTGIGAGLVSGGRLHRGALGCAGDIGHAPVADDASSVVCRCGKLGCLEALAGGAALGRDGRIAAEQGRSPFLAQRLAATGAVTAADVVLGARSGDRAAVELITHAGQLIGTMLATLVSFFNPSVVLIGGRVAEAGDTLLATVRQTVYSRSLPLATRDLRVIRSPLQDAGLRGAALMVIDELFDSRRLGRWIDLGSPSGHPELVS